MMTLVEIARRLQSSVEHGEPDLDITGLAGIREAAPGDLTFLAHKRYRKYASMTRASAMLAPSDWDDETAAAVIRVADPEKAFTMVSEWYAPPPDVPSPGVHSTALIGDDVELGEGVSVGPYCVIGAGCRIGKGTVMAAHCVLGTHVVVGAACRFYPMVTVREHCRVGDRTILSNGVVIGNDGFGYQPVAGGLKKISQNGIVVVGNDVEIGANTTVDRARFGVTRIGDGVKIDNLVQVAHNVNIGAHTVIAGMSGISGSAIIGRGVQMGANSGIGGHLVVGDGAIVAGRAGVSKDVAPGQAVSGFPAMPHDLELRRHAHVMRLPQLKKRVAELEERVRELEKKETS